jgi:hypothetical protein
MGVLVVAGLLIFAYSSKNRKTAQITGSSSDSPLPIPTAPPLRNGEEVRGSVELKVLEEKVEEKGEEETVSVSYPLKVCCLC